MRLRCGLLQNLDNLETPVFIGMFLVQVKREQLPFPERTKRTLCRHGPSRRDVRRGIDSGSGLIHVENSKRVAE
jgi:hypothetical protein